MNCARARQRRATTMNGASLRPPSPRTGGVVTDEEDKGRGYEGCPSRPSRVSCPSANSRGDSRRWRSSRRLNMSQSRGRNINLASRVNADGGNNGLPHPGNAVHVGTYPTHPSNIGKRSYSCRRRLLSGVRRAVVTSGCLGRSRSPTRILAGPKLLLVLGLCRLLACGPHLVEGKEESDNKGLSVSGEVIHLRLPIDFPKEAVVVAFARLQNRSLGSSANDDISTNNFNYNYNNGNNHPAKGNLADGSCGENNECLQGFRLKGPRKKAFRLNVTERSVTILLNRRLSKIKTSVSDSDSFELNLDLLKDDEVLVSLELKIVEPFICSALNKDLCFFPREATRVRQWENRNASMLLQLPNPSSVCPSVRRSFRLLMSDDSGKEAEELTITGLAEGRVGPPLLQQVKELRTRRTLDREWRGSSLPFSVECLLEEVLPGSLKRPDAPDAILPPATVTEAAPRAPDPVVWNGTLTILDENDNPPIFCCPSNIVSTVPIFMEDMNDLVAVYDADELHVNHYEIELRGDKDGLTSLSSVSEYTLEQNICRTLVNSNPKANFNSSCTIITPMVMSTNVMLAGLPMKYNLSLHCTDKSLLPGFGVSKATTTITLLLDKSSTEKEGAFCEDPLNPGHRKKGEIEEEEKGEEEEEKEEPPAGERTTPIPRPTKKPGQGGRPVITVPPIVPKPENYDVVIHGSLPKYSRLRTLSPPVKDNKSNFILAEGSQDMGVAVTPRQGIVYALEPGRLREGVVNITQGNRTFFLRLIMDPSETNDTVCDHLQSDRHLQPDKWCSQGDTNSSCHGTCGLGSGTNGCQWRPYSGREKSHTYGTCSPNLDHCPDGVCDELEDLHPKLCGQDCADRSAIQGQHIEINEKTQRGIWKALGVCTCEDKCVCFPEDEFYNKNDSTRGPHASLNPRKKPTWQVDCGVTCMLFIVFGALFLTLVALAIICCYRKRFPRGTKHKHMTAGNQARPSDYVEERPQSNSLASVPATHGEAHVTALHSIHHQASPRTLNHDLLLDLLPQNLAIDKKWEFPRNRLVIEQTLGEGEFGKVMKARAHGINGTTETKTVAVKMLKSNSTPVELADLLSEYTLLKEVSHPNVIRLLGACTSKGGPIYIIMEYCLYGSLRSYLRRSRHVEFENRVGSGPAEGTVRDYDVTPRELLCFAWQICKGMAYLTGMKLVHRDLAARNILLAEGKVCKISDFGLTRDVYEGELYLKRSKGRVPVKWMALESLVEHMYTSKSDVWSFGILLWELVTLGSSPYPGITPERLFGLLKSGHRMSKPENCSQELYEVMTMCWHENPSYRPSFKQLTDIFDRMIKSNVEYLELGSLMVTNRTYFDGLPLPIPSFGSFAGGDEEEDDDDDDDDEDEDDDVTERIGSSEGDTRDLRSFAPVHNSVASTGTIPLDEDSYLVARSADPGRPVREESREPLLALSPSRPQSPPHSNTTPLPPVITLTHAHNSAYSPTSELAPQPPILHYSTLASRPDEEDLHAPDAQEGCRSEEDSDSGRATGDSGYITEEPFGGRFRVSSAGDGSGGGFEGKGIGKTYPGSIVGEKQDKRTSASSSRSPSTTYSPINPQKVSGFLDDEEDDAQDTSEDMEERQELLTPSPDAVTPIIV